MDHKKL